MKRYLIIMMLALSVSGSATAQSYLDGCWFGGLLVERDRMTPMDIFSLTQTSHNFGTARSMAMAGAFTSLGADMSSMSLNPAGLGMYRHSELSLTPMMTFERSSNSAESNMSNHANRFSVGNIGVVFKAYEGTGRVLAVNIGLGYNRTADYNSNYSFKSLHRYNTFANVLERQLNYSAEDIGVNSNGLISNAFGFRDFDISSEFWGGVLGYKSRLLNYYDSEFFRGWGLDEYPYSYSDSDIPFYTDQYTSVRSRGSAGEYAFSVAMNVNNKFYIGATLGIFRMNRKESVIYGENIFATDDAVVTLDPEEYTLQYFDYMQYRQMRGSGVDFKIGMVWRPTNALRLGFAFHTPTYYSVNFNYSAGMKSMSESRYYDSKEQEVYKNSYENWYTPEIKDNGPDTWEFASPARMMFGASYAFGALAVLSVDYERDWYNGIRMKNMPSVLAHCKGDYNDYFRTAFKGSNTVRVGVEVKPAPRVALRAGYGFNSSMLRENATSEWSDALYTTPVVRRIDYWSVGAGFALSQRVSLDVAYQHVAGKSSSYSTFYAYAYDDNFRIDEGASQYSQRYTTKLTSHNVALTMNVKF